MRKASRAGAGSRGPRPKADGAGEEINGGRIMFGAEVPTALGVRQRSCRFGPTP